MSKEEPEPESILPFVLDREFQNPEEGSYNPECEIQIKEEFVDETDESPLTDEPTVEYLESEKGKPIAVHDGFVYYFFRKNVDGSITSWRCSLYKKQGCRGSLKIKDNAVTAVQPHSHSPNPETVSKIKFMNDLNKTAASTTEKTSRVVKTTLLNHSGHHENGIFSIESLSRIVRRKRQAKNPEVPIPSTLIKLEFLEES